MTSQCETGYSMTTSKPSRAALGHSRAPYPYMLWSLVYSQHAMESPPTSNASSQWIGISNAFSYLWLGIGPSTTSSDSIPATLFIRPSGNYHSSWVGLTAQQIWIELCLPPPVAHLFRLKFALTGKSNRRDLLGLQLWYWNKGYWIRSSLIWCRAVEVVWLLYEVVKHIYLHHWHNANNIDKHLFPCRRWGTGVIKETR